MQLTLEKKWVELLENLPESGMGYQRVHIRLRDGRDVENAIVLNSEVLEIPDDIAPFRPDDIIDVGLEEQEHLHE
ncbi:MAG: hypothetical protein HY651_03705 [Acidobacteria bacterium]|nr:hypothetical protein [Acidobacteriota bacterium]